MRAALSAAPTPVTQHAAAAEREVRDVRTLGVVAREVLTRGPFTAAVASLHRAACSEACVQHAAPSSKARPPRELPVRWSRQAHAPHTHYRGAIGAQCVRARGVVLGRALGRAG